MAGAVRRSGATASRRGLAAALLAVGLVVGAPGPAGACGSFGGVELAELPDGVVESSRGTARVEAVHEHVSVAWAPALWPLTSQRATLLPARSWGVDGLEPVEPAVDGSRQPYDLFGNTCGPVRLPKPGQVVLTVVGRPVDAGGVVRNQVARPPGPTTDAELAVLHAAFGAPLVHPPRPVRAALAWPVLWWPHLLLGAGVLLLARAARSPPTRPDDPWPVAGNRATARAARRGSRR
jgi:hypothetical protein